MFGVGVKVRLVSMGVGEQLMAIMEYTDRDISTIVTTLSTNDFFVVFTVLLLLPLFLS